MTRNEQILLMMTWALPFHGLSPEDAQAVGEIALDELGGDISEIPPSQVIHKYTEVYFRHSQAGEVSPTDPPMWEDYGCVRPPQLEENFGAGTGLISDGTAIDGKALGFALSEPDFDFQETPLYPQYGIRPDGSLRLYSGGLVPPIQDDEKRKRVWVAVFKNPFHVTQEEIDGYLLSPPLLSDEPDFLEQQSLRMYEAIMAAAHQHAEEINEAYHRELEHRAQHEQHGHTH